MWSVYSDLNLLTSSLQYEGMAQLLLSKKTPLKKTIKWCHFDSRFWNIMKQTLYVIPDSWSFLRIPLYTRLNLYNRRTDSIQKTSPSAENITQGNYSFQNLLPSKWWFTIAGLPDSQYELFNPDLFLSFLLFWLWNLSVV